MCDLAENCAVHAEILSELYGAVAACSAESRRERTPKANAYVKKAIAYIEHNYSEFITVNDIIGYMSLNRSYFTKIFKEHTGSSPQKYLIDLRIRKSAELIRTTELKLSDICKCVGIREEYYFWRLFRRSTGYSPSDYRREMRRFR